MNLTGLTIQSLRLRKGAKWNNYNEDIIPAWVADMDFPVADAITSALSERITCSDFGYPVAAKDTKLPDLFRQRVFSRFRWDINLRDVLLLTDVVQGLYHSLFTFSKRGEGIIVQTPIYPPFLESVRDLGRKLVPNPLAVECDRYSIDFDHLYYCLKEKPKILMFCNPHNPSGRAFTLEELEKLATFACRNNLTVISDEIHSDLILGSKPHIPLASLDPEIAKRTITFMSASKSFNIAGLCLAFTHFGSESQQRTFKSLPGHVCGSLYTLSLAAVEAAWTSGEKWLSDVLKQLRTNRSRLKEHVDQRWPSVKYLPGEATYLAWLDMRDVGPGEKMGRHFMENGCVALSEGETFGVQGRGFVRLNFATSNNLLSEILERMDSVIRS